MRKASILAALMLIIPSLSFAKTLEDLLVEKGVITKGEARTATSSAPAKVYYNNGTRFDFSDVGFTTKINTLVQARYQFTDADEEAGNVNTSSFTIPRARIMISGTALHEEFSYGITPDFSRDDASLLDAFIVWNGCDWFALKMGQFKTGIGRQFNSSDHTLQFADRSLPADYFDLGRQAGAVAKTEVLDGAVVLTAGIFNGQTTGEGINEPGLDTKHTGILTARWSAMGKMDTNVEGDIDWTEDAAINLGLAYANSDYSVVTDSLNADINDNLITADVNFKYTGWGFHGEYFVNNSEPDDTDDEDVTTQGFYVQGGYFLKPKTLEIAARFGLVDCDDGAAGGICSGNDNINEASASVNYHWWKHNLKAQLGYSRISENPVGTGEESDENRWIFQLTSYL